MEKKKAFLTLVLSEIYVIMNVNDK